jgi:hypothetical protein
MRAFMIELEPGVWLTDGEGDPPRTLDAHHATQWDSLAEALKALEDARRFHPFTNARLN